MLLPYRQHALVRHTLRGEKEKGNIALPSQDIRHKISDNVVNTVYGCGLKSHGGISTSGKFDRKVIIKKSHILS